MKKLPIHQQMQNELETREIFDQAVRAAFSYMDHVTRRPVYPNAEALSDLRRFDETDAGQRCFRQPGPLPARRRREPGEQRPRPAAGISALSTAA